MSTELRSAGGQVEIDEAANLLSMLIVCNASPL